MSSDYWKHHEKDVRITNSLCGDNLSAYSWAEMTHAGIERQILY
jgi:hypothetical protein